VSHPIVHTIILKVVAPCNLNCTYCYEYNRGDDTWKTKPKTILSATVRKVAERILEHVELHKLPHFNLNLHGGEPMMLGAKGLDRLITTVKKATPGVLLRIGMQTNATLTSDAIIEVLRRQQVSVGASLDGNEFANRFRIDHRGRESWQRATTGILKLSQSGVLAGIQSVINLDSDPGETLVTLHNLGAKIIELGQPFGNYANPPVLSPKHALGEWLIQAFDFWTQHVTLKHVRIPVLEDALLNILTGRSTSDWFPSAPPGYIVVATDGAYEGLDTLKVVGREGREFQLNVENTSIDQVAQHPFIVARSQNSLSDACQSCAIKDWCHGGYYPTRFSNEKGFDNPSFYCSDWKALFRHLGKTLHQYDKVDPLRRAQIEQHLQALQAASLHSKTIA
jgi:uncharacterized protein